MEQTFTLADGRTVTLAQFRAELDAAKAKAHANFERTWGVPCTKENVRAAVTACVDNAHLFKPSRRRRKPAA